MKQEIVVPRMGESISEATIGAILKESGSHVEADDEILELETDKVNQVLYAPAAGVITLNIKPQQVVKIGEVLGFVDSEAEVPKRQEQPKTIEKAAPKEKAPEKIEAAAPATRLTKEAYVKGLKEEEAKVPEVKHFIQARPKAEPGERKETRKKLSKIRRVIAERMLEAQSTTASLTTFNEVDLTQVIMLRDRYRDAFVKDYGIKLGLMSFFVKAAVSALKEFPEVNAYLDGEDLVYREYFDIGIAVSTDRGVIVPVVRGCDYLSFADLEKEIDLLAQQARASKISVDDLQGAGFTITNGGVFGSLFSTPILTPPQTGILGMHKIVKRPVAFGDQILIRPMMYLALTYDHRVIDGREAVSFLVHVKQCLEDPARLLLEI